MKMTFLVDGDNNMSTGLKGIEMLSNEDTVLIFHRKGMELTKIKNQTSKSKANIQFIESVKDGKNSIDFQIIAELGVLIGKKEIEIAYIISQDQGYVAPISLLKKRHSKEFQEVDLKKSIEECLKIAFILKASTIVQLSNALVKEYGNQQGTLVYRHIKKIFSGSATEDKQI